MTGTGLSAIDTPQGPGVHIQIKVVPGASRDRIVGAYGDRLKVQVSAPPEGGKANKAVVAALATQLGVSRSALSVVRGTSNPHKTIEVVGLDVETVGRLLYG